MSAVEIKQVKKLREETGVGIMACKKALAETAGDLEEAKQILEKQAVMKAKKRADRETSEGVVSAYIHTDGKKGALVELNSETDFVSRSDDFQKLADELAMQVCAMDPEDKDALLAQEWIRDPKKTIRKLIQECAAKTKENIELGSFYRIEIR